MGQRTQQRIQAKPIDKATEKPSTAERSVSEMAYALGVEHVQLFS